MIIEYRQMLMVATLGLMAVAPGCGSQVDASSEVSGTVGGAGAEQAVLVDRAFPLSAADVQNAVISDTQIVFSQPSLVVQGLRAGDIIASGVEKKSFIRRVTGVAPGAEITVQTVTASLLDMTQELQTRKHIDLPNIDAEANGLNIVGNGVVGVTCATCTVKFNPSIDIGLNFSNGKVEDLSVEFDGLLSANAELVAATVSATKLDQTVPIYNQTFHFVQYIGNVPLWEDVTVSVNARVVGTVGGAGNLKTGVGIQKRIAGGVAYDGTNWAGYQDGAAAYTQEPPKISLITDGSAKLYLVPRVDVKLFGVAGAYLQADSFVGLDAHKCPNPSTWTSRGGITVTAGGNLTLFGIDKAFDKAIFTDEQQLSTGTLAAKVACP